MNPAKGGRRGVVRLPPSGRAHRFRDVLRGFCGTDRASEDRRNGGQCGDPSLVGSEGFRFGIHVPDYGDLRLPVRGALSQADLHSSAWSVLFIMRFMLFVAVWMVGYLLMSPVNALTIRQYEPSRHDYVENYPESPRTNAAFFLQGVDLSGIGWSASDPQKHFGLVSPKHIVGANHFKPGVGTTVRFLNRSGTVKSYGLLKQHPIVNAQGEPTDLFLGELENPIPDSDAITCYPYLNLLNEAAYNGKELVVVGKQSRIGNGTIAGFLDFGGDPLTGATGVNPTRAYQFAYALAGGSDDCHAEPGDSGSPSFAVTERGLAIVGIHTAIVSALGQTSSVDTFVPHYQMLNPRRLPCGSPRRAWRRPSRIL
ncbi:MAG: hypothetical protein ACI9R3_002011 [Verrucomicrobiales bacterium]|jgi:hypothetical protein